MTVLEEILSRVREGGITSKEELNRVKLASAKRHKVAVPRDADLLALVAGEERERFRVLFRTKSTRTASGVAIVAVQTSPEWCPHGTCTYCPGGPQSQSAKSYTGFEPAALRAGRHGFDPYAQVADRVKQLKAIGHDTDKVDLILMGGTLTARDLDYQQHFVKRCFDAFNDDGEPTQNRFGTQGALTLDEAMARNESAANRCIGITVETKPDWFLADHVDVVLGFGATRVELGIQSTFDDVLERVHRGHDVAQSIESTRLAREAGLKVCYHMMPGLPGSSPERDLESFRRIFEDPDFRPDMIKIYPTLVVPGTQLYDEWRRGEFEPLTTEQAAEVVSRAKEIVPPWVRIQRVDRDIPTPMVAAGVDKSNLREIAVERLRERTGRGCGCVRCREVGFAGGEGERDEAALRRIEYDAGGGTEVFLSLEDPSTGVLHAYLRLRRFRRPHRPELRGVEGAMIRELKVPGRVVPLGQHDGEGGQHRGQGQRLLEEAARLSFDEWGLERLFVLSGVGVKPYYRRLGFQDDGVYLSRRQSR